MAGKFRGVVVLLASAAVLSGCMAGPPQPTQRQMARIDRALASAPGTAQPSVVVATEVAFARMARDDGQWTAFRHFAADDGVLHGAGGPIAAKAWLASQSNPPAAVQWAPRIVWMSCDGMLAVSQGRFRDPDGMVGTFNTVWQRQSDGTYRYLYDGGEKDDPQPVRRPETEPGEGEIVVTAIDSIRGEVADCRAPDGPPPPPIPEPLYPEGTRSGGGVSPDGTLVWSWVHLPDGRREITSSIYRDGSWEEATRFDFGSKPAG